VVIRPLFYSRERDIARWAEHRGFPIIPCNLCGSQENLQRQVIKEMLQAWDRENPGRVRSIARSLRNVVPSHLGDPALFDFAALVRTSGVVADRRLALVDLTDRRDPTP
jgi:tRNA 2-thiocytidine biosynthesis protein TtcA